MYRELMQSILTYDWNSEKIVSIAFANLLSHIISSNVTFLLPILSMLVRTFTYSAAAAAAGATSVVEFAAFLTFEYLLSLLNHEQFAASRLSNVHCSHSLFSTAP